MKGELHFYFATGEQPRPQFIGETALNENGHVVDFDQVYDIHEGDKIHILDECFRQNRLVRVSEDFYFFLYYLSMMWNDEVRILKVDYKPAKGNKSWGWASREYAAQVKNEKK